MLDLLTSADAMVTTVLAAGGAVPAAVSAGGSRRHLERGTPCRTGHPDPAGAVPDQFAVTVARQRRRLSPLDVATQVAVPEFDGRIITVPFSFKEIDDEGLISYVADPERCARVAGLAVRHARLRAVAPADKRVAVVFSAYPTKHARIGNAVGLDTPASAVALLRAMRDAGYRHRRHPRCRRAGRRRADPRADRARRPGSGLAHRGPAGGQSDSVVRQGLPRLVRHAARRAHRCGRTSIGARRRASCSSTAPHDPDGEIVIAAMQAGNVVLMVQPPRGFGENPVAIYHDPDLPPSHHYLAAYHWLADEAGFGADASSTSASTATWSGCPARRSACRRRAAPTPRWATCR